MEEVAREHARARTAAAGEGESDEHDDTDDSCDNLRGDPALRASSLAEILCTHGWRDRDSAH
eukprot:6182273-Pleurochrysis_carterae.AAC.1